MYLYFTNTIDCARSTLLITVNTFCACVYVAAIVGELSYLFIVLMGHTMVVNIQHYFLIPKWLTPIRIGDYVEAVCHQFVQKLGTNSR